MRLEVLDYSGPRSWRWCLTDDAGGLVADRTVALDADAWELEAFTSLHRYLRSNVTPDRRQAHEAELVAQVGDWITREALGADVVDALARARGTVRLEVPAEAAWLGYRPWELARAGGRTLAEHRTSFVVVPQPHRPLAKNDVGERLRMLAVFSLPEGAGALNLRRERYALTRLVQRIAKVTNKAIDLRVLQYGATRHRLEDAMLERPGWDLVHLSGHGLAGGLVLETDTGAHDLIVSTELVDLLDWGADQIKLVTLSACESAAVTAREHLEQLGLAPADLAPADLAPAVRDRDDAAEGAVLPAVAAALVERLDCAVLAMRFPVADEFAINLAGGFYDLLLGRNQPVGRALALTLPRITATADAGTPALSAGTPVLFGPRAVDLTLSAPPGTAGLVDTGGGKLAGFPPAPERFVGRVGPLTRAAAALAPDSGHPGVLFHGMAGGGKTACAVELAHDHTESFPFMAFHRAPDDGQDITTALADFALALERQLPGLTLTHLTADVAALRAALPGLSRTMADNRILIVLDNAESLLTPAGAWRDERWRLLVDALGDHQGLSRLVLTSRTRPTPPNPRMVVEAVHALSLRESVLLAREWPHLRALIDATPVPGGLTTDQAHELAARALELVQGHPKLIELADGIATDPDHLRTRLAEADTTWLATGTRLDTFVHAGESEATDRDFLAVLQGWTRAAAAALPDASGLLFQLLCGLEEPDRLPFVIEEVWPKLWEGDVPDWHEAITPLADQALVALDIDPGSGDLHGVRIHPGVADTARGTTRADTATAVDTLAGDLWLDLLFTALTQEQAEKAGPIVVRAARSAGPYLLRRHRWADLATAATHLLERDRSTAAAAAVLPLLSVGSEATGNTPDEMRVGRAHARAQLRLHQDAGEALLRRLLDVAVERHDPVTARALAGDLLSRCRGTGRLDEALTIAETKAGYTRQAGLGPWSQLADQGERLQVLHLQGRSREVLDAVHVARELWATLPDPPADNDYTATPWNVREAMLNLACVSAVELELWDKALEFNAANLDSKRDRGASTSELASAAFNDYAPLLGLGRAGEARDLLLWCRQVDEADNNIGGLGNILSALAGVEEELGHSDRSIELETDALRYTYLVGDVVGVPVSHHNLANYLQSERHDPRLEWAHRLAAALIRHRTGDGNLESSLPSIARLLDTAPDPRPATVADVIATVEQIDGVRLGAMLDQLPRDRAPDDATAYAEILALADAVRAGASEQVITQWDPALAAMHTARHHPDPDTRRAATATLERALDAREQQPDWRDLAPALRRLLSGDHDPEHDDPAALTAGLDDIDTTVVTRALDLLTGRDTHGIDPETWRSLVDPDDEEAE